MVSRFVEFTKNIPMLKTFHGGLLFQANVKESAAAFAVSGNRDCGLIDVFVCLSIRLDKRKPL
jgi:hypothetical protein